MIAAALPILRRLWWLIPIVALATGWLWTDRKLADVRLTLANERQVRAQDLADAEAAKLRAERDAADRVATATATYADRLADRAPIVVESTNTVREYAQTDAGRARCLGPDRVRGLDALAADLARVAGTAAVGADAMRSSADSASGGR